MASIDDEKIVFTLRMYPPLSLSLSLSSHSSYLIVKLKRYEFCFSLLLCRGYDDNDLRVAFEISLLPLTYFIFCFCLTAQVVIIRQHHHHRSARDNSEGAFGC
jgi:hypothetical protein